MDTDTLNRVEGRLRDAVRVRQLDGAVELLAEYRAEFDRIWGAMNEEDQSRSSMPGQALNMMDWMKAMVIAFRAEMDLTLKGAQAAGKYARGGYATRQRERTLWL